MWCETSGVGRSTTPGPDLGIHLGMSGRIVVVSQNGQAAEGGEPRRLDAQPNQARWNRFTLEFADGGRLVLVDKRRLGRIRLNPDIDALGPDAHEVTPGEFPRLIMRRTIADKAPLLDQSKIAGVGKLLAEEVLWEAKVPPGALGGARDRRGRHGGVRPRERAGANHPAEPIAAQSRAAPDLPAPHQPRASSASPVHCGSGPGSERTCSRSTASSSPCAA